MGIQFPPIAFLYLLYFCIYIFFCTLVRSFIKLKHKLKQSCQNVLIPCLENAYQSMEAPAFLSLIEMD